MTSIHGVKVYNLSVGKTLPEWLSDRKKRALNKDEEFRKRIELLQDFDFPSASRTIKMSANGQYVVVTGTYPPMVKVFNVAELSMKFERHIDSECVDFEVLTPGYEKLALLLDNKTVNFHAPYGSHHTIRIPSFGRNTCYHRETCDLMIASSTSDIYRFNLDEGRFHSPLQMPGSVGANKLVLSNTYQLLAVGSEDGWVHMFDSRANSQSQKKPISSLHVNQLGSSSNVEVEVTSLAFSGNGLTLAVGTSDSICALFDLRSPNPVLTKEHQYGLPILDVRFLESSATERSHVISTDAKILKAWDKLDGSAVANIEAPVGINGVCVAHDSKGDSGLLLLTGEQSRVMSYYVPALGPAPRWCSFLDNLTEELEDKDSGTVYDDYKFITRDEVESLGIVKLIGTKMLHGYMHGYFINYKLYNRLKAVREPFAYENYRREKLKEKIEAKRKSRIALKRTLPSVNRELAKSLLTQMGNKDSTADNPIGDERFKKLFTSPDFEVDMNTEEYQRRHPSTHVKEGTKKWAGKRGGDSDDENLLDDRFEQIHQSDSDSYSSSDRESEVLINREEMVTDSPSDAVRNQSKTKIYIGERSHQLENGRKVASEKVTPKRRKKTETEPTKLFEENGRTNWKRNTRLKKPNFFELKEGEEAAALAHIDQPEYRATLASRRRAQQQTLMERVEDITREEKSFGEEEVFKTEDGVVRQFSYIPKAADEKNRNRRLQRRK